MIRNLPIRTPNPQERLYAQLRASVHNGSVTSAGVQAYLQTFCKPCEPSVCVWQALQTQCLDAELEADVDRICAEQLAAMSMAEIWPREPLPATE